jgi:glycosyltransferase involved in cell wall biosynthesis
MYRDKRVALVIPAYNEQRLIRPTLEDVPAVLQECAARDARVDVIRHPANRGPGAAIVTGYQRVLAEGYDLAVVCGGDHQMPLDEVTHLLDPLIDGRADYVKGNRFMRRARSLASIPGSMPRTRVAANMLITMLTKIASGYYKVADVVEGYTAINREALERIDWERAWPGYGYPMDFLIRLNAHGLRVLDVPRRAIYLPGERQSQIRGLRYALRVSPMLVRGFFWRLWTKYVLWDFHPLVFFFALGLTLLPSGVLFGCFLVWQQLSHRGVSGPRAVLCALLIITGLQSLLFAMLFDMQESNR